MTQFGQYDPTNTNNNSSLFAYKEVPLTSTKLNRWNANIDATFLLLQNICGALLHQNTAGIICTNDNTSLQAIALSPATMQVIVQAGWAFTGSAFTGLKDNTTIPQASGILAPQTHPRWDHVVITQHGELYILTGDESENPALPETPENALSLAKIIHRPGSAKILDEDDGQNSYIVDLRSTYFAGIVHQHQPDTSPPESPDGSRTQFTTQFTFQAGSLDVYLNGVLQQKDLDYTENSDHAGYTFIQAPLSNYRIQHRYLILHK